MFIITEYGNMFRSIVSVAGLLLFVGLGLALPFRQSSLFKNWKRVFTNLSLTYGNAIFVFLVVPITLIQVSLYAKQNNCGLFNYFNFPNWLQWVVGLLLLDLIIYWQHRFTHNFALLWRLHRIHHTDLEFDSTTAGRFHPLEILFSLLIKAIAILFLGLQAEIIIVFEVLLNFSAMFNHANFSLPIRSEKFFKWFIVTPDMHRIHHSTYPKETNSNYGFCLSIWDRLFRSYTSKPKENPQSMPIGLKEWRDSKQLNYWYLLKLPFL